MLKKWEINLLNLARLMVGALKTFYSALILDFRFCAIERFHVLQLCLTHAGDRRCYGGTRTPFPSGGFDELTLLNEDIFRFQISSYSQWQNSLLFFRS